MFFIDDRTTAVGLDDPPRLVENQTVADFEIRTSSRHRDEASAFGSRACSERICRTGAPRYIDMLEVLTLENFGSVLTRTRFSLSRSAKFTPSKIRSFRRSSNLY